MKNITYIFIIIVLFSCKSKNNNSLIAIQSDNSENRLFKTNNGDTLEDGYWKYDNELNGISKNGKYISGFKVDKWVYKSANDSVSIYWNEFNNGTVRFNYPRFLEVKDSIETPVIFQGNIVDNDNNTYIALIEYNLSELNATIYDYIYQLDKSREKNSFELLISKEVGKYYFKNVDIFKYEAYLELGSANYIAISYVFEVENTLYDLTLKNSSHAMTRIVREIFKDMLYSLECDKKDLFTFNSGKYLKVENIIFE